MWFRRVPDINACWFSKCSFYTTVFTPCHRILVILVLVHNSAQCTLSNTISNLGHNMYYSEPEGEGGVVKW